MDVCYRVRRVDSVYSVLYKYEKVFITRNGNTYYYLPTDQLLIASSSKIQKYEDSIVYEIK